MKKNEFSRLVQRSQLKEERMQEFLLNNTVNCNLMSLTGYRTLVILNLLMESPKSTDEINEYFFNHQYIKEKFSNDTLRIYINSLREIGCEITRANKSNKQKYELISHPFTYDIPKNQIKAIEKLYKNLYEKFDIKEIIAIDNLFDKLSSYTSNKETKEALKGFSLLKNINKSVLEDLITHCKNKNQITFLYNSPKSNAKKIELITDTLSFKSGKLYLYGNNLTHNQYSYFSVDRIIEISSIKLQKEKTEFPMLKVIYELTTYNNEYTPQDDEKIIETQKNKLIIEINAKNEFSLMQKILHMANDCKVIYPEDFKTRLLNKLKLMEKSYENI